MPNNKFTRKELERLNISDEDIELLLKCQKTLPVLFDNDGIAKYSVNAIDLWNQIGSQNNFSHWIKNNILESENINSEDYQIFLCKVSTWEQNPKTHMIDIEIVDENEAKGLNPSQLSANKITKSCMLTLDAAKDIIMYIGALPRTNATTKEISKMYRKYFRILEKAIRENKDWLSIRDPEKEEYNRMSEAVNQWCHRIWNHKASKSEYAVEADMLNGIVLGMSSKEAKMKLGIQSTDMLRDYLKKEHNEELLFLERQNTTLLLMDMGFTERKNMLQKMYNATFKKINKRVS